MTTVSQEAEAVRFTDLEEHITDLARAVKILKILLFRDAEEAGFKTEFLSLLSLKDLEARSKELVRLYYKTSESGSQK